MKRVLYDISYAIMGILVIVSVGMLSIYGIVQGMDIDKNDGFIFYAAMTWIAIKCVFIMWIWRTGGKKFK